MNTRAARPGRQGWRQHQPDDQRNQNDFKPVAFSPIRAVPSSGRWAWPSTRRTTPGSPATSAARSPRSGPAAPSPAYHLPKTVHPWSEASTVRPGLRAGFATPRVWLLCGADTAACPPGSSAGTILSPKLGFQSAAFQHFTSIQVDQSGNIWLSNNWSKLNPPTGGVGIAEIVGAATPVCTPLTPVPVRPSSSTATACARQTATPLAARPACFFCSPDRRRGQCQPSPAALVIFLNSRPRRVLAVAASWPRFCHVQKRYCLALGWLLPGRERFLPAIKLALYLGESKDLVPALGVSSCSWAAKTVSGDVLRCLGKCARWFRASGSPGQHRRSRWLGIGKERPPPHQLTPS